MLENLVKIVADDFRKDMEENGFESFQEMSRCYMWDSSDIRAEVEYIVNSSNLGYMGDEGLVLNNGDLCEYKDFIRLVRKSLKSQEA